MQNTICPRCEFPNQNEGDKCFICGFKLIEDVPVKMLNLPKLDYKNWTAAQQLRKIGEEFGEVAEAVAEGNPVQIIRESLDAIQTLDTLINIVADEYRLDLARFYREHEQKLIQKGYISKGGMNFAKNKTLRK